MEAQGVLVACGTCRGVMLQRTRRQLCLGITEVQWNAHGPLLKMAEAAEGGQI